jgi:hypothetical protein
MNRGLVGFDGASLKVGIFRSDYVPLSRYVAARKYVVAHPFDRRPAAAFPLLRCKIAEAGYLPGQEFQYVCTDSTSTNHGCGIKVAPYALTVVFGTVGFVAKSPSGGGNTGALSNANWDLAFLVLG